MIDPSTIESIKTALVQSPRNDYTAELHLQIIKHSADLEGVTGKEFCTAIGIPPSFGTEFAKMKKISTRLKEAGLNVKLI